MKAKDLDYFKKKLEHKRAELIHAVQLSESYGREAASERDAMDIVDRASSAYTKEFMFSKSNSDRRLLQSITDAISRITEGEFGECLNCEKPVERKRLEAIPWAGLCVGCQEKEERGEL